MEADYFVGKRVYQRNNIGRRLQRHKKYENNAQRKQRQETAYGIIEKCRFGYYIIKKGKYRCISKKENGTRKVAGPEMDKNRVVDYSARVKPVRNENSDKNHIQGKTPKQIDRKAKPEILFGKRNVPVGFCKVKPAAQCW